MIFGWLCHLKLEAEPLIRHSQALAWERGIRLIINAAIVAIIRTIHINFNCSFLVLAGNVKRIIIP
jgi:hypothetical protein